jgi:hypothetical protein
MYIHVGLTRNNLALPNVYYGDMGQKIETRGDYCGYSFDHLIAEPPRKGSMIDLREDEGRFKVKERIPLSRLVLIKEMELNGNPISVYRVVCDDN